MKIIFICLGNICRSPMAEAVFRDMVEKAGLSDYIQIDSAATSSWEQGNPVHQGTVRQLAKVGISTHGMYSRQLNDNDLNADYLIGMDEQNIQNIRRFVAGRSDAQIVKLLHFADSERDIADPWYTDDFDATYRDVVAGCSGLLELLQSQFTS